MKYIFLLTALAILAACGNNESSYSSGNADSSAITSPEVMAATPEALALREHVRELIAEGQRIDDSLQASTPPGVLIPTACGTRLTPHEWNVIWAKRGCEPEHTPANATSVLRFPIEFVIITKESSTSSTNRAQVQVAFDSLQSKFKPAGIEFSLLGINEYASEKHYDFDTSQENELMNMHKNNAITVLIFNSIKAGKSSVLGYARLKIDYNFIMITGEGIINRTTLPHEIGHFFLLYHTHGKVDGVPTDELVERDNCSCSGDDVCDTPADPNLKDFVLKNCKYTSRKQDSIGKLYQPDPYNLMSYAVVCRKQFTLGQCRRMRWAAIEYRDILLANPFR